MRNDVSIPPDDFEEVDEILVTEPVEKEVSTTPIPPPESLEADVTLYDHPDLAPGGAGNFWLLGMIGLIVGGVVVLIFWMLHGLMK